MLFRLPYPHTDLDMDMEVDADGDGDGDAGNPILIPYPCYAPLDGLSNSVSVRRVLSQSVSQPPPSSCCESDVKS